MDWEPSPVSGASGRSLPDDLVPEVLSSEQSVHHGPEVGRDFGIAVEIDAAGRFEYAPELYQSDGHVREVCQHRVVAGCGHDRTEHVRVIRPNLLQPLPVYAFKRPDVVECDSTCLCMLARRVSASGVARGSR